MKTLTTFAEVSVLMAGAVWALNEFKASSDIIMLTLIAVCVLGSFLVARLVERD